MKKTVVLGVTSGIAAFRSIELVELLRREGVEVFVIQTANACKMVDLMHFEKASGNKVYTELFEKGFDYKHILKVRKVDHIEVADRADVFVIAPATANIIAKIANGFADDFLTTAVLATQAPVIVCPSMNVHMWQNPIVEQNISMLRKRGVIIIEPEEGQLACGYQGKGRLAHIEQIRDEVCSILKKRQQLKGKKILVTAGATIEKIDDVRFITNRSSGKMGLAIAQECFVRGADVLLLRSLTAVKPSMNLSEEVFETTGQLEKLIEKNVRSYDFIYHTAAVSDFRIARPRKRKISSKQKSTLAIEPTRKIINDIKKLNPKIKLIAFKAQWGLTEKDVQSIAKEKLNESKADAIIVNDISKKDRGFEVDTNEVFIVTKKGCQIKIPLSSKQDVARDMIDFLISEHLQ